MLRELTVSLVLESRIKFLGSCRYVEPYMQAADGFVCPSIWEEATGLVNLEALSCGVPVVASAIGGIPEFIEHGKTGLLFTPGDHHELADRVNYLLDNPIIAKRMGESARVDAVERFSVGRRLQDYIELYSYN
jgi:glycosyltransferase involved in cell wall biosynthesis